MGCMIWSTASNKPAMARQPIRGWAMARTSRLVLPIWRGLLGQTYWRLCLSRPGYPERTSFPDCRKIFPTQSTSTPPKDASPLRPNWGRRRYLPPSLQASESGRLSHATFNARFGFCTFLRHSLCAIIKSVHLGWSRFQSWGTILYGPEGFYVL